MKQSFTHAFWIRLRQVLLTQIARGLIKKKTQETRISNTFFAGHAKWLPSRQNKKKFEEFLAALICVHPPSNHYFRVAQVTKTIDTPTLYELAHLPSNIGSHVGFARTKLLLRILGVFALALLGPQRHSHN
jgi:hypothetical protein